MKTQGVIVYHGDCLIVLNDVHDKYVDLVFADPPYNIGEYLDVFMDVSISDMKGGIKLGEKVDLNHS